MSNSIEKLAKEAERLAENLKGNPFSAFDRIEKDIQEQKENAIAMEFTKSIGELLRKNGVVPKIKQYGCDFYGENSFQSKFGVIIDELDFSEHDKVFEDKIAKLEKENKSLNSYLVQREQDSTDMIMKLKQEKSDKNEKIAELACENQSLKQRIDELEKELEEWKEEARVVKKKRDEQLKSFRKGIEPYVDLLHMHETIAELKQHITELESKEVEKPTKINLNDRVKVKLTPLGAEIYYHQYDEVNKQIKENGGAELEPIMPRIDKDGYTEFQLWHFMELYGEHIGMCKPNVINPLDIIIVE